MNRHFLAWLRFVRVFEDGLGLNLLVMFGVCFCGSCLLGVLASCWVDLEGRFYLTGVLAGSFSPLGAVLLTMFARWVRATLYAPEDD